MTALNHKEIIRICNLALIALITLLIILQFVPFLYNVDGTILTQTDYDLMCRIGSIVPGFSQITENISEHISVAKAVWLDSSESMSMGHIGILFFGIINIIISLKNRHSTLSGLLPLLVAYIGLSQSVRLGTIVHITGITSMLIAPFALILCVYHIWKMYTWFTVEDSKYRSMWGLR